MDEEKLDDVEQTLSKEEILERSRNENKKNGDEREREKMKYAPYAGWLAGIVAIFIVEMVCLAKGQPVNHLLAIMTTMLAAQTIYQAVVAKRFKIVFCITAAIIAIGAVMIFVVWGLELAGIDF